MKTKLLSLAALLVAVLAFSGCYDAYPGGYGYGSYAPAPVYGGGYYPAGGWGNWGGWGYPAYYGHDWDWDHGGWGRNHGGWDHDHFVVPEHGGFVAHNFGAPMGGGRGFAVAHNEGFHGGGYHRGGGGGWHGDGGGFHGAARGGSQGGGSHGSHHR